MESLTEEGNFFTYGPEYLESLLFPDSPFSRSGRFFNQFSDNKKPESSLCTNCSFGLSATHYCTDCPEYLCRSCLDAHETIRVFKDHVIKKLDIQRRSSVAESDLARTAWQNSSIGSPDVFRSSQCPKRQRNNSILSPILDTKQAPPRLQTHSFYSNCSAPNFATSTPNLLKTSPQLFDRSRRYGPRTQNHNNNNVPNNCFRLDMSHSSTKNASFLNDIPFTELSIKDYKKFQGERYSFGGEGNGDGQLNRPWGICCDQKGRIVVSDRSNNRIQIFAENGTFIAKFGKFGQGPGEFNRPAGVTTNLKNQIIVADKDNHRIQVFDENGRYLFKFGQSGRHPGSFNYPWGLATNSRNDIAVTDSRNNRIQIFNNRGELIKICGRNAFPSAEKQVFGPRGIVFVDDDNILVSDFNGHRIVQIDITRPAESVEFYGTEGQEPGCFTRPQGMVLDRQGHLLVCDSRGNRIQIVSIPEKRVIGVHTTEPDMDRPCDITISPQGKVFVVDFGHSTIRVL
ncbi:unnamed protein product [Bursaphelenchus okinawaensis]|uniref:B box-type domain-containing protein n=1 Tax=Bursaphelenchus okinawaensis TaxID=465554 RepID=A0A811JQQ8_9BILA|nr:unnamed protein product [Bursaphelenchus okinawaensis]CAG9078935.1 unnamed protein product [Bursaphelenchus okinawaensis]